MTGTPVITSRKDQANTCIHVSTTATSCEEAILVGSPERSYHTMLQHTGNKTNVAYISRCGAFNFNNVCD